MFQFIVKLIFKKGEKSLKKAKFKGNFLKFCKKFIKICHCPLKLLSLEREKWLRRLKPGKPNTFAIKQTFNTIPGSTTVPLFFFLNFFVPWKSAIYIQLIFAELITLLSLLKILQSEVFLSYKTVLVFESEDVFETTNALWAITISRFEPRIGLGLLFSVVSFRNGRDDMLFRLQFSTLVVVRLHNRKAISLRSWNILLAYLFSLATAVGC